MTEETLKCPFCEKILDLDLGEYDHSKYYSCIDTKCGVYGIQYCLYHILALIREVESTKQKSYSEGFKAGEEKGYEKGRNDVTNNQIFDEGYNEGYDDGYSEAKEEWELEK